MLDPLRQRRKRVADMLEPQFLRPGTIHVGYAKNEHLGTARQSLPAEQTSRQANFVFMGTHHNIVALAGGPQDTWQTGRMAEGIDVIGHFRETTEAVQQITFPDGDLPFKAKAAWKITVRLDPPAAHDLSPAGSHQDFNAGK